MTIVRAYPSGARKPGYRKYAPTLSGLLSSNAEAIRFLLAQRNTVSLSRKALRSLADDLAEQAAWAEQLERQAARASAPGWRAAA